MKGDIGKQNKTKQTWEITPNFPFTQCKAPASFPSHSVTLTHGPACQHPITLHAAPRLSAEWALPSGYATSPSVSIYPPQKGRFLRVGIGWLSTHRVPSTQERVAQSSVSCMTARWGIHFLAPSSWKDVADTLLRGRPGQQEGPCTRGQEVNPLRRFLVWKWGWHHCTGLLRVREHPKTRI